MDISKSAHLYLVPVKIVSNFISIKIFVHNFWLMHIFIEHLYLCGSISSHHNSILLRVYYNIIGHFFPYSKKLEKLGNDLVSVWLYIHFFFFLSDYTFLIILFFYAAERSLIMWHKSIDKFGFFLN